MADLKISQLPALGDNLATGDKIALVDSSSSETKSLTVANLFSANSFGLLSSNAIPIAKISVTAGSIAGTAVADLGISTAKVDNDAITSAKLDNNSSAQVVTSLPGSGGFTGQIAANSNDGYAASIWDGSAWQSLKAAASINSITGDTTSIVNIAVATSGSTRALSASIDDSSAAAQFLAGPSGAAGAVSLRAITGADLPTATSSALGAIKVNGEGLRMDTGVIEIDNDVSASSAYNLVAVTAKGLVSAYRTITAADLPDGSTSAKGALQVGSGLAVSSGVISVDNTATAGTYTKVTITASGLVSSGTTLSSTDLPAHSAALLTSGNLDIARVPTNAITGVKLADASTTQFGGPGSTSEIVTFPTARFKGDRFWDEYHGDEYIWTGSSWAAVTITGGELIYGGTYNAASGQNKVASVTTAGAAAGLQTGVGLPTPSATNIRVYVVVSDSGTGSGNAPAVALAPPDMLVSNGTNAWDLVDVSNAIAGQTASNISFTPYQNLASTNTQAVIQELDDEKVGKAGINTITGTLEIGTTGILKFEGSTANAYEIQLSSADPLQASRNIVLPDQSGTVLVSGGASIVNADVATNAALAYSKLAALASGSILVGNGSNVATVQAVSGDATLSNAGVLTIAASAITNAKISSSAAIALSKLATGALPTAITVTNGNVASDAAIAGSKISPDFGTQAITTTGNLTLNNQADLRLGDSDGSHYVAIQAGATVGTSYTIELPTTVGATGKVLKSTVSGQVATLTWETDATDDAAANLTGTTLASNVVSSSLTSVGTLTGLVVNGDATFTGASSNVVWDKSANAFTGTIAATAFSGPLTGNITGNCSGTALSVTQAAQSAITSLGTLTGLEIGSTAAEMLTLNSTDGDEAYIGFEQSGTRKAFLGIDGNEQIIFRNEVEGKSLYFQSKEGGTNYSLMTLNGAASSLYYVLDTDAANTHDRKFRTTSTGAIVESSKGDAYLQVIAETDASGNDAVVRMRTYNTTNGYSRIEFGDTADADVGRIYYYHPDNALKFVTDNTIALTLDSSQNATFAGNITSDSGGATTTLQLDSDTESSIKFNDHGGSAKAYRIGTNISSNDGQFEIKDDTAGAERFRIATDGAATFAGTVSDSKGDLRSIPKNAKTSAYVAVAADADVGRIYYYHPDNALKFVTDNTTALTLDSSQNATFAGTVSDSKGNLRSIPRLDKTSAYTITAADAGKTITADGNITIPNSVMAEGDAITIIADGTADITITQGSGFVMYNAADASTGNRTLALRGMATIRWKHTNYCYISGAGLS